MKDLKEKTEVDARMLVMRGHESLEESYSTTPHNRRHKDAQLLYMCNSLHGAKIIKEGSRHDFVPSSVSRNAADRSTLMRYESRFRYHNEIVSIFSNGIRSKGSEVR